MGKHWSLPPRSDEHRRKISEAQKRRFADPAVREAHSKAHQGQTISPAHREKIRAAFAKKWADPVLREEIRAQKIRAMQCRKSPTYPEKRLAALLDDYGIAYSFQVHIDRYLVDFLVPPDIIIEVDGEHWHAGRELQDAERDARLNELGYKVIRIPSKIITRGKSHPNLRRSQTFCTHCKQPYSPLRRGLCAACSQYQRVRGFPRPIPCPRNPNAAKTECIRGHPFDEANTRMEKKGGRACRACCAIREETRTAKRRAKKQARTVPAPEPTCPKG